MPFRVAQLTDLHLFADKSATLLGHNTWDSFEAVLDKANALDLMPELLILTGDLAQDHQQETYRLLDERMGSLGIPCIATFGNHDAPLLAQDTFSFIQTPFTHMVRDWQLILLDTHVDEKVFGTLSQKQLQQLGTSLANTTAPSIVFMHHQPMDVGSDWIDQLGLTNASALWNTLHQYPQVKAVSWGHIHQTFMGQISNVSCLATPATCIQFQPQNPNYAIDLDRGPGFRLFDLQDDGSFESQVVRLENYVYQVDTNAAGY